MEFHWSTVGASKGSVWTSVVPIELADARELDVQQQVSPVDSVMVALRRDHSLVERAIACRLDGRILISDGRLLAYSPRRALGLQLAFEDSGGLFDQMECPGWDLWLGLCPPTLLAVESVGELCLLSWIPHELVPRAAEGIRSNPPGWGLEWVDEPEFIVSEEGSASLLEIVSAFQQQQRSKEG